MRHDLANSLRALIHLEGPFRAVFSVGLPTAEKVIATTLDLLRGRDRRRDPLHEASSLPDLAGARVGSEWQAERLALIGIRPTPKLLAECLGLPTLEPAFSLPHLPESAAAAVGLVRLGTKEPLDVAARLAAMHLAAPHVGARAASRMLGHSRPTGYRLLRCAPDPVVTRAIGLQMALRLRPPLRPVGRPWAA